MREYAAIDLGAESGRVVRGRFDGERIALDVVHRFANRPVRLPDGLRWDLLALFGEALDGLRRAAAGAASGSGDRLAGVGVDAWGVDYALLDAPVGRDAQADRPDRLLLRAAARAGTRMTPAAHRRAKVPCAVSATRAGRLSAAGVDA